MRSDGKPIGGIPFTRGPLQALLRNRVYVGDIIHKGQQHAGEHQPVGRNLRGGAATALLTGRIFDSRGDRMSPSHASKHGVRYCYYVSRVLLDGENERAGHPARIPAGDVEALIVSALRVREAA